jgi:hypothetical protein
MRPPSRIPETTARRKEKAHETFFAPDSGSFSDLRAVFRAGIGQNQTAVKPAVTGTFCQDIGCQGIVQGIAAAGKRYFFSVRTQRGGERCRILMRHI